MHIIAQQQTIPLHSSLLCSVNAAVPGRRVKVWPRLEGPTLPKQARGCVGGHQGGFYQEGSGATHGVSQHLPYTQSQVQCSSLVTHCFHLESAHKAQPAVNNSDNTRGQTMTPLTQQR